MAKKYIYIALIVLIIAGAYLFWRHYQSQDSGLSPSDNVGGKTPQETLNLLVVALEKGDTALAASYFMDTKEIKREDWRESFNQLKDQNLLDDMLLDIKNKTKPDSAGSNNQTYRFIIEEDGTAVSVIVLQFNPHTNVWKIEQL